LAASEGRDGENPHIIGDYVQLMTGNQMDLVLWHKFTQNRHLKKELLSTGDAELVEVSRIEDRAESLLILHRILIRTHFGVLEQIAKAKTS
jgi:hypothetical protein